MKKDVESVYQEAITNMKILGIDALVVLGGEGTLTIASEFHKRGVCVCGVPKTIDNDLACTELTFGFVTALDIATEALDRLHTTAESHDRVMILEVMGRHAGLDRASFRHRGRRRRDPDSGDSVLAPGCGRKDSRTGYQRIEF